MADGPIIDTSHMVNPCDEIPFLCMFLEKSRTPNAGTPKANRWLFPGSNKFPNKMVEFQLFGSC